VVDDAITLAVAVLLQYSIVLVACGLLLKTKQKKNVKEDTGLNLG